VCGVDGARVVGRKKPYSSCTSSSLVSAISISSISESESALSTNIDIEISISWFRAYYAKNHTQAQRVLQRRAIGRVRVKSDEDDRRDDRFCKESRGHGSHVKTKNAKWHKQKSTVDLFRVMSIQ
jgi:hypothetical protein